MRSGVSESPKRMFSASAGLTLWTSSRKAPAKVTPRSTSKHSSAPSKSGSASSTMQPSASSLARAVSSTVVTSGSTGRPPT